ncbi:NfeD family protein [Paenibacillus sp. MBLB4367]|uniref:NfeD family protein n=1 Tax=Paenibacillus sp. MBLB4367 TaxID=3384767 RepID=UPI003908234E
MRGYAKGTDWKAPSSGRYNGWVKRLVLCCMMLAGLLQAAAVIPQAVASGEQTKEGQGKAYYVVPVRQTIESGLLSFMERAFDEAKDAGAKGIVLDINTLGGRVDAALDIGELVRSSGLPTAAYIRGKAASAGSYIALNAGKIVMEPGSSIGAAAVVDSSGKEVESSKTIAFWAGEMRAAAELNGRNPLIAEGMVDKSKGVDLPAINRTFAKGEIVSLTAEEALKVGYADKVATGVQEAVKLLAGDEPNPVVVTFAPTFAEKLARFLTSPYVMPILLLIGIAGVAIEIFVPGFGLPGILGVLGFGLYFFGHYVAGFAGVEEMVLFIAGVVLLVIEVFLPSFGILGIAGIICIISGVVMAAADTDSAWLSLGIAFAAAIVVVAIFVKVFKHRGIWNKFILREELKSENGYVASMPKQHLLGKEGRTLTPLRPAGTVRIDGERVDVVTSGEFVGADRVVTVILIEGGRVVVREIG